MEAMRLRVKDLDFSLGQITVRDGKGEKDRVTVLPQTLVDKLRSHLRRVKMLHDEDRAKGYGEVALPYALSRKYRNAARDWGWQYVFPASKLSHAPGEEQLRRHHLAESVV
jgi:integrase